MHYLIFVIFCFLNISLQASQSDATTTASWLKQLHPFSGVYACGCYAGIGPEKYRICDAGCNPLSHLDSFQEKDRNFAVAAHFRDTLCCDQESCIKACCIAGLLLRKAMFPKNKIHFGCTCPSFPDKVNSKETLSINSGCAVDFNSRKNFLSTDSFQILNPCQRQMQ